jgi:hypothetical protein
MDRPLFFCGKNERDVGPLYNDGLVRANTRQGAIHSQLAARLQQTLVFFLSCIGQRSLVQVDNGILHKLPQETPSECN